MSRLHTKKEIAWRYGVGCAIVTYLLVEFDFRQIFEALSKAEIGPLSAGMLAVLAIRFLHAWQNWLVLRRFGVTMRLPRVVVLNLIVGFYSLFLPSGSAGLMKWYRLSRSHGNASEVLAALLLTKTVNTAYICGAGSLALIANNIFSPAVSLFAVLLLLAMVSLYAVLFVSPLAERMGRFCDRKRDSIGLGGGLGKLSELLAAVSLLRNQRSGEFLLVMAAAVVIQFLLFCLFAAVAAAVDLSLPASALVWIGALVYLIHLIPVSISGLGVREGALVLLMPHFNVAPFEALAFSLIIFAYAVLAGLLGGVLEALESLWGIRLAGREGTGQ